MLMTATMKNRVPVSLRLPRELVDAIDSYTVKNDLKKTDAYIHFLQRGISLDQQDAFVKKIDSLHHKIDGMIQALAINEPSRNSEEFESATNAIADIAERFPAIKRAYIFGSFARGAQSENSDIDIRLDLEKKFPFRLNDLSHFMKLVEQNTGRECDVITAANLKNKKLAENIDREKVLIYERKA